MKNKTKGAAQTELPLIVGSIRAKVRLEAEVKSSDLKFSRKSDTLSASNSVFATNQQESRWALKRSV